MRTLRIRLGSVLPKLGRQQQRHPVGQRGDAERREQRRPPAMVLPVPSLSVVVSASGMYWLTLRASSAGTVRLKKSFDRGRAGRSS